MYSASVSYSFLIQKTPTKPDQCYGDFNLGSSSIEKTEVTLKNTSTRAGFDCELKLRIENKSYVITNTFDWSLSEMKLLFEYIKYIKYFKCELLTEKEKFYLSRMTEKIKKTNYNNGYNL